MSEMCEYGGVTIPNDSGKIKKMRCPSCGRRLKLGVVREFEEEISIFPKHKVKGSWKQKRRKKSRDVSIRKWG